MPYIVTAETTPSEAAQAAFDVAIPAGHQADDILLAIVGQDGGATTISASGWNQIGMQSVNQGQRTTAFWLLATGSGMADLALTGSTEEWVVTIIVVRGADTDSPINANIRTDSANNTGTSLNSGVITTTADNCLIIYAWGYDGGPYLIMQHAADLMFIGKDRFNYAQIVGYKNQQTAGATAELTALSSIADGAQALVIAINDVAPATPKMGPDVAENYTRLFSYGAIGALHDGVTWLALSTLAATIDGLPATTAAPTVTSINANTSQWGNFSFLNVAYVDSADRFYGACHSLSSTDFSDKLFCVQMTVDNFQSSWCGAKGFIIVFKDGSGNWAAFRMSSRSKIVNLQAYLYILDVTNHASTLIDSSGSIDWTDIIQIGYAVHRYGSTITASRGVAIKSALLLSNTALVDGCAESPVNYSRFAHVLGAWDDTGLLSKQGASQILAKSSLQIGSGTRRTYADIAESSLELPVQPDLSIANRWWQVEPESVELRIKAGATDIINFVSCVLVTKTRQRFVIDSASSPDAAYDFAGASFIGWQVENNVAGVEIRDATFKKCYGITLNGGKLASVVTESVADPAVVTNNPGNISDCDFTTDGSGHAIEITQPGTYTFAGNRFYDYGADATADAAIFNNSGGLVTLNITDGGDTPTVLNGSGASTVVNNTVTLTVSNVVPGSDVVIYDADSPSTGDGSNVLQTYDEIAGTQVVYSYSYVAGQHIKIGAFKSGYVPQLTEQITLSTVNSEVTIKQQPDRNYV